MSTRQTKLLLILCGCLLLSPLAPAKILTAGAPLKDISIYETATLGQKFVVVGKVTVTSPMQNQLVDKIKNIAKKKGGDAVLNYKILQLGQMPAVGVDADKSLSDLSKNPDPTQIKDVGVGAQAWPTAEGVIVRYDPQGITEIAADTVIPVLQ